MTQRTARIITAIVLIVWGVAILFASGGRAAEAPPTYTCTIDHIIDGDTIAVTCPTLAPFARTELRVYGLDTPESRRGNAKCVKEIKLGLIAKAWAKAQWQGATAVRWNWHPEASDPRGRKIADVTLPNGRDWASEAIRRGHGAPYFPAKAGYAKPDWCGR